MKRILTTAMALVVPVEVLAHGNHTPMPESLHHTFHSLEALLIGGALVVGLVGAYVLLRHRGPGS